MTHPPPKTGVTGVDLNSQDIGKMSECQTDKISQGMFCRGQNVICAFWGWKSLVQGIKQFWIERTKFCFHYGEMILTRFFLKICFILFWIEKRFRRLCLVFDASCENQFCVKSFEKWPLRWIFLIGNIVQYKIENFYIFYTDLKNCKYASVRNKKVSATFLKIPSFPFFNLIFFEGDFFPEVNSQLWIEQKILNFYA
jgi:hypothetical protein